MLCQAIGFLYYGKLLALTQTRACLCFPVAVNSLILKSCVYVGVPCVQLRIEMTDGLAAHQQRIR